MPYNLDLAYHPKVQFNFHANIQFVSCAFFDLGGCSFFGTSIAKNVGFYSFKKGAIS